MSEHRHKLYVEGKIVMFEHAHRLEYTNHTHHVVDQKAYPAAARRKEKK